MVEYKRRDMPEDMIVRISPGRNTITVQECSANGVVSYREIDPIEFYFALNGSCISNCLFKWEKADSCADKETQTDRLSESKRCQRK